MVLTMWRPHTFIIKFFKTFFYFSQPQAKAHLNGRTQIKSMMVTGRKAREAASVLSHTQMARADLPKSTQEAGKTTCVMWVTMLGSKKGRLQILPSSYLFFLCLYNLPWYFSSYLCLSFRHCSLCPNRKYCLTFQYYFPHFVCVGNSVIVSFLSHATFSFIKFCYILYKQVK